MMLKNLKIFSQNIQKSNFLINTVLEVNQDFDIIFIQEPLWTILRSILSTTNPEGIPLLGFLTILIGSPLSESHFLPMIFQESLHISMSDFLLFVFHLERTLLITGIFSSPLSSITILSFGS